MKYEIMDIHFYFLQSNNSLYDLITVYSVFAGLLGRFGKKLVLPNMMDSLRKEDLNKEHTKTKRLTDFQTSCCKDPNSCWLKCERGILNC